MGESVRVNCFTNLDLFNEDWPKKLPCRPIVGDYIKSKTIHRSYSGGHFKLTLKVVAVTLTEPDYGSALANIDVELHDYRDRSVKEFYEWYAPLVGKSVSYFI